jgi:hypothetical protein
VIAVSRGLEYRFIVSGRAILSKLDHSPLEKTETPRLTMMTCIGHWDPIQRDYDERLWVVAEPPEIAEQTIAHQAEQTRLAAEQHARVVARATATAEARAASQATATAGALAKPTVATAVGPAVAPEPAARPPLAQAGVAFRDPAIQSRDGRQATIRGLVATPVDRNLHVWLFTRQLDNGPWYSATAEIVPSADGTWESEIVLEGAIGTRHEIRVGTVNAEALLALQRHLAESPGQPLAQLPEGFLGETTLSVTRNR